MGRGNKMSNDFSSHASDVLVENPNIFTDFKHMRFLIRLYNLWILSDISNNKIANHIFFLNSVYEG